MHVNGQDIDIATEHLLFENIVMLRGTLDVAADVDIVWAVSGMIPCNGDTNQVPGGVVCTGVLASVVVWVIWCCRSIVLLYVCTNDYSIWEHGQMLPLHLTDSSTWSSILFLV